MFKRNSIVQNVHILSILGASVFEIGDSVRIMAISKAIAVQRESQIFYGNEGNFNAFPIFSEPIPIPISPIPAPIINKYNELPNICVGRVAIKGVSTSGIFQIGNTEQHPVRI